MVRMLTGKDRGCPTVDFGLSGEYGIGLQRFLDQVVMVGLGSQVFLKHLPDECFRGLPTVEGCLSCFKQFVWVVWRPDRLKSK